MKIKTINDLTGFEDICDFKSQLISGGYSVQCGDDGYTHKTPPISDPDAKQLEKQFSDYICSRDSARSAK